MSPPPSRRAAFAVPITAIALILTACSGELVPGNANSAPVSSTPSPSASSSPSTGPAPDTSAAPDTSEPAADTDLTACATGDCEVRVTTATELPVPSSTTVEGLRVESIGTEDLTFTGRTTGNSSNGSCTGRCRLTSTNNTFKMTLGVGSTARQNGLTITVVAISSDHAVVRLDPQ